jgi:integrase/recombinase XerD
MTKHRLICRDTRLNKYGQSPLYFIVNSYGTRSWIATGIFVFAGDWDDTLQEIKERSSDYRRQHEKILQLKYKAATYFRTIEEDDDVDFSLRTFKQQVLGSKKAFGDNPTLVELFEAYPDFAEVCPNRKRHYEVLSRDLQEFSRNARIKSVNYEFMVSFNKWLTAKNNAINTRATKLRKLKAVVHYAYNLNIIKKNPVDGYRIKAIKNLPTVLKPSELKVLKQLYERGPVISEGHHKALKYFLYCCYTGLRYGDLKALRQKNIHNNTIFITMHKTKLPVEIPLLVEARALMDECHSNGKVFDVPANETLNKYLKDIGEFTRMNKILTFHVSRHTFATISLLLKIEPVVIQKLMGHTKLSTTLEYLQVLEQFRVDEISKWSALRVA